MCLLRGSAGITTRIDVSGEHDQISILKGLDSCVEGVLEWKMKGKIKKGVIPERERISGSQVRVGGDWEEAKGIGRALSPRLLPLSHSFPRHTTFPCLLPSPFYSPSFLPYDKFSPLNSSFISLSFTSPFFLLPLDQYHLLKLPSFQKNSKSPSNNVFMYFFTNEILTPCHFPTYNLRSLI